MKKVFKSIILIIISAILSLNIFALTLDMNQDHAYEYIDEHKTVVFEQDTQLSEVKQKQIADLLVYGESPIETYELSFCWLFGHDYVEDTVYTITHKVYAASPRCLRERYNVTTCSKCDYNETELVSRERIVCCPAD